MAYSKAKISIPNVTGNIVITATAEPSYSPVVHIVWNVGKVCPYTTGSEFSLTADAGYNYVTSSLLSKQGFSTYKFTIDTTKFSTANTFRIVGFDSNGICTTVISYSNLAKAEHTFTLPSGTTQFAIRAYTTSDTEKINSIVSTGHVEVVS